MAEQRFSPGQLMTPSEALRCVESLGDSQEFALVQQSVGGRIPAGLFHRATVPDPESMIRGIEAGFDGMFRSGFYRILRTEGSTTYVVECRVYGFRFHADIAEAPDGRGGSDRLIDRLQDLKTRFLGWLRDDRAFFVYHSTLPTDHEPETAFRLLSAIRRHGRGRLLFVSSRLPLLSRGVVVAADGLFLARPASEGADPAAAAANWGTLVRAAVELSASPGVLPLLLNRQLVVEHVVLDAYAPIPFPLSTNRPGRENVFSARTFKGPFVRVATAGCGPADKAVIETKDPGRAEGAVTRADRFEEAPAGPAVPAGPELAAPAVATLALGHEALGYLYNNGGLNNQKLTLLGLFMAAKEQGRPIRLPDLFLHSQETYKADVASRARGMTPPLRAHVALGQFYDLGAMRAFAKSEGIGLVDSPADGEVGGWTYFHKGADDLYKIGPAGSPFTRGFFNALKARIAHSDAHRAIARGMAHRGISVVLQCRVEQDWMTHIGKALPTSPRTPDQVPGLVDILGKVRRTLAAETRPGVYLVNDEAGLPIPKTQLRQEIASRFGFQVYWKSDFVPDILTRYISLQLSMLDFEIAVDAPIFVGTTTSTFSNMAAYERFARTGRPAQHRYIYNGTGENLEIRIDNGVSSGPVGATRGSWAS
ncbi:MAG TPA: hypothetical protein VHB27_08680 [Rhodopila sp.]|uniref:hypothetical protein n=1 Tax=Rhodopila sp. TaxID=2480087 RepID=UPI002CA0AD00|nr:hypothetical protein [Rhodopila sp.]HVY15289.1 hypothetical protein [Rhodopila sp.]